MNPDKLRMQPRVVEFVKHSIDTGKPVAAVASRQPDDIPTFNAK